MEGPRSPGRDAGEQCWPPAPGSDIQGIAVAIGRSYPKVARSRDCLLVP
jgi:hypothetical protein